jgi:serine/threonine protein kinase
MDYYTPLGPQALGSLFVKSSNKKTYDKEKNDIWSLGKFKFSNFKLTLILGITILSMLMNEDFNKYYDWTNYQILYDVIRSRIKSLGNKLGYSSHMIAFIEECLKKDEKERISVDGLYSLLTKHKDQFMIYFDSPGKSVLRRSTIDNCELYSQYARTERPSRVSRMSINSVEIESVPRMSLNSDYADPYYNRAIDFTNPADGIQFLKTPQKSERDNLSDLVNGVPTPRQFG